MLLNLDIWYEIVDTFAKPLDRKTLCSLALTSRCLSDLALDVLWGDGPFLNSYSFGDQFIRSFTR